MMNWSPRMRCFFKLIIVCLTFSPFYTIAQTACNGHADLCDRKYSNVTQIGAHNSPFVGHLPSQNQDVSVTDQLNRGIRFLQAQSHFNIFKSLNLCHTNCFLEDAGSVTSYLSGIKRWLDNNPTEVVTLLLTNGDRVDVSLLDKAFTSSGLKPYAYIPPSSPLALDEWPTLRELITTETRLVAFLDYGANAKFPYILDEFVYFFETPFDTIDPKFPQCSIDRPPKASPDGLMYIVNHYLDIDLGGIFIPNAAAADTTNGIGSIGAQIALCEGLYGRAPMGILVDYFNHGDVFTAQNHANGISAPNRTARL